MNYLDPTNKLFIFIGWWVNYSPFFKDNLEKTFSLMTKKRIILLKSWLAQTTKNYMIGVFDFINNKSVTYSVN